VPLGKLVCLLWVLQMVPDSPAAACMRASASKDILVRQNDMWQGVLQAQQHKSRDTSTTTGCAAVDVSHIYAIPACPIQASPAQDISAGPSLLLTCCSYSHGWRPAAPATARPVCTPWAAAERSR
jgi:hypothetical protein